MTFYHALQVDENRCMGCSHCMTSCPTEAIRVRNGKAVIDESKCIDCGNCFKACSFRAIYIKQDDFESIFGFKCRVALLPSVFLGQFPQDITVSRIYNILKELGFTHIFETDAATSIFTMAKNAYIAAHPDIKPLISSFCPAVVRLIQVRFPGLVENIMPIKAPIDIMAIYARRQLKKQMSLDDDEIGIFYITPCAAKIAAVKNPVGEDKSNVDGVINMDSLYNRVYKKIKEQGKNYQEIKLPIPQLSSDGVLTSLTNGERRLSNVPHSLSIDEIQNVTEFLEKVENDEIEDIDFLELRACDQSCPGGILTCDNRFLICERMFARARKVAERERNGIQTKELQVAEDADYLLSHSSVSEVKPRSMMSLDNDISKAMEKMNLMREIHKKLPQIDCGVCGAPTCEALAADVACGKASLKNCIFIQRNLATKGEINREEILKIMEEIWGKDIMEYLK